MRAIRCGTARGGIRQRHRDRFTDLGDGILGLIHPVDQAPEAALLQTAVPALSQSLADYNASLPRASRPQRQLRVRVVMHAGEVVSYDANGCFGEALDIAFRPLVRVQVGGNRYPGWIHIPGQPAQPQITEIASYRQPA